MRLRLLLALAIGAIALLQASGASAAITVTNGNDSGPGSLRQTIAEVPAGETIVLPAGTYSLTSGELVIEKALTITGDGAGNTIIRADGPFRVILVNGAFDATISGVTIRDGLVTGTPAQGAGVFNNGANLTLRGVAVTANVANSNGAAGVAGSLAQGAGMLAIGPLSLIDSTVHGNLSTAVGGSGASGGLAQGAGVLAVGPLTILKSTIADNTADARGGQGPANAAQTGGSAQGAALLVATNDARSSIVSESTISGNLADASAGPGGAKAGSIQGGAVLQANNFGPMFFASTTIATNQGRLLPGGGSLDGGGLLAVANAPGFIAITGVTLSGNRYEVPSPASGKGGGNLFASGSVHIGNTIVANGFGPSGSENCVPPTTGISLGFNLDSTSQCGFTANGDQVNKDPQLGPLQSNGGPTATMAPALGSPVIDQGSAFGPPVDQRGLIRPIDFPSIPNSPAPGADGADIGAFELQPSNALSLGRLKRNRRKGTATLTVNLPQPSVGTLTLSGKGLKPRTVAITGQGMVKVKIATRGGVRKALRRRGKRRVRLHVTYTPTGTTSATQSRTTKLIRKKRKKRSKGNKPGRRGQRGGPPRGADRYIPG